MHACIVFCKQEMSKVDFIILSTETLMAPVSVWPLGLAEHFCCFFYLMQAYAELLEEEGIEIPAWFSFNSKDGTNVVSGDPIAECVSIADSCKQVVAVGINCTPPRYIHGLITSIRKVYYFRLIVITRFKSYIIGSLQLI